MFIINALAGRPLPVYGDGQQTRDWLHTDDHCVALRLLLEAPSSQVAGEVFNIGSGEERSILQNARAVVAQTSAAADAITHVDDRLGHVRRHAVNSEKLRRTLGWGPTITFDDGLRETITWYQTHPDWIGQTLAKRDTFLANALTRGYSIEPAAPEN